jgi:subtilase family serine protease
MNCKAACRTAACLIVVLLLTGFSLAQSVVAQRITRPVNDSDVALLPDGVHPNVARAVDQGSVAASMPMQRMAIFFKPSAAQQADLDRFLQQQQNPSSPNYHKWLTPEQYADRFGMSSSDLAKVSSWLQSRGFRNIEVGRSRSFIEFNGSAGQASAAFRTPIHQFQYNGRTHYANTASPQVPSAFAAAVAGITSLNNFRPRPMAIAHFTSSISGSHFLVPGDVGTIYNINSLYGSGINGTGETIAVVGQTTLTPNDDGTHADVDTFRSLSGLPAINFQQKKSGSPTYSKGDVDEANLDLEWSGAIAPNAVVIFYYSDNALFSSLNHAVQDNIAAVISVSYGNCEANFGSSDLTALQQILTQANTQGQTITSAAGDSGAADCDGSASSPATQATHGLAVDVPAATPYVTGLGGSEFTGDPGACANTMPPNTCPNGGAPDTQYWKGSSSPTDTSPTALSYIPEMAWNDTDASGIAATGGGLSKTFSRPAWQAATDFQASASPTSLSLSRGATAQVSVSATDGGQRGVPDISLTSSPNHDGYLICSQGSCVSGFRKSDQTLTVIGGTSVASPVFAGVVTLMNQKFGNRLGNIDQNLYALAASAPNVYHDITTGDNKVPCQTGTTDCPNGGTIGYSAGTGYDLVTGLGSIDVGALVSAWPASNNPPATQFPGSITLSCSVSASLGTTTCSITPTTITTGQSATMTVTATNVAGLRNQPRPGHPLGLDFGFGLAAVCFIPLGRRGRTGRILRNTMLSMLGLVFVVGLISCGGGGSGNSNNNNNNSSTPLTGTVTVTAVSGGLSHAVSIPVTIN